MAAVNRCQGFYWLRIYHLTDGAICAPPKIGIDDGQNPIKSSSETWCMLLISNKKAHREISQWAEHMFFWY